MIDSGLVVEDGEDVSGESSGVSRRDLEMVFFFGLILVSYMFVFCCFKGILKEKVDSL